MSEERKLQLLHEAHHLLFDENLPHEFSTYKTEECLSQKLAMEIPHYLSSSLRYIRLLQKQVEALNNLKIK